MKARRVIVRNETCWVVPIGKRDAGKRIRVFGATKEEAMARAKAKLGELREHGGALSEISSSHRGLIIAWRDKLSAEQMATAFRQFAAANPTSKTVREAAREYTEARAAGFSSAHATDTRYRLRKFVATFTDRPLAALIPGELETFIAGQGGSARNFYRALHAFFAHARRHRWTALNPMEEVLRPDIGASAEKEIFKPAQMRALLNAAAGMTEGTERHEPTLALLVLGGLCGLRYTEALRLDWSHVDLGAQEIHLDKLKTSKRGLRGRFVKILPAAAAWLATLPKSEAGRVVRVSDKNAKLNRARILKAAKVKTWPHNALRRSWGSYHLAAFENADLTAAQMGHTSAETTFGKYRTLARKAEGEAWFALIPDAPANVVAFAA